ncbi:hypothetical protein GCM10027027_03480 [Neomicrococcus lactis]
MLDAELEDEELEDAEEDVAVQVEVYGSEDADIEPKTDGEATGAGSAELFLKNCGTTKNAKTPMTRAAVPASKIGKSPLRLGASST